MKSPPPQDKPVSPPLGNQSLNNLSPHPTTGSGWVTQSFNNCLHGKHRPTNELREAQVNGLTMGETLQNRFTKANTIIQTSKQAASTNGNHPRTHGLITLGSSSQVSAPWRAGAARKPGWTRTPHLRCCQDFWSLWIGNGRKREPIPLVYNTGGKTWGRRLSVYSLTSLAHQAELWVAAINQSCAVPGGEHTWEERRR